MTSINNSLNMSEGFCIPESEDGDLDPTQKKALIWIAYRIIGPIVVGIGLLGNVLNLIVLTRPSLKGVTYTYLIGLACSDLGVLLCSVAMMIRLTNEDQNYSWPISFFYGHLEIPLSNFFMASSIFIVVCLTVDRFSSVCLPTKFKSVHTRTNAQTAILLCYAVGLVLSFPLGALKSMCRVGLAQGNFSSFQNFTDLHLYTFVENTPVTTRLEWRIYVYLEAILVRFIPACILAVLNILIIRRFRQISNKRREILRGGGDMIRHEQFLLRGEKISRKIYKEEKRLVILLTAIVLLFFITISPVAFLGIFYTESLNTNVYFQMFRAVANDLELCNFALNFYVYFLCSKEFRKKFLSFFIVLLPKKPKSNFQSIILPELSNHNNHICKSNSRCQTADV